MRNLHGRRIRITVHRNHFDAEALQFDYDFLTQFSRTQEHRFLGERIEGGRKFEHI